MLPDRPGLSGPTLLTLFCSFEGRIGRAPYWAGSVAIAIALGLAEIVTRRTLGPQAGSWLLVLHALAMLPLAALAAKRAIDRGRSAYWGVVLVLFTVGSGLLSQIAMLPTQSALAPIAAGMRLASTLAWLVLLVDLGCLPSQPVKAARRYRTAA